MIYITGDCHSNIEKLSSRNFGVGNNLKKDDYVIICGDFGLIWNCDGETQTEKYWLDWLNNKPFTTLFVDGNHENFDRLYKYPTQDWHGGKIHKIRDSVFHLMRGEIFEIDGKKIFAFGGAASHDIQDGILEETDTEKIYRFRKMDKMFRIRNYSWWEQELPTSEEMANGIKNLQKVNWNVDYIVTHCAPNNIQKIVGNWTHTQNILTDYLQEISEKCKFDKWFFGHYHVDKIVNSEFICTYDKFFPLDINFS